MVSNKVLINMTINGQSVSREVEPRQLLVHFLRQTLNLTGTHVGCDTSQCGVCTVLIDGQAVKSCTVLAVQADRMSVTTVEGLQERGKFHPVQEGFWQKHGLQCGFCTPGAMMTAAALLSQNNDPSEEEIRHALDGVICRCTGYENIVRAIQEAQRLAREEGIPQTASSDVG